MNWHASASSVSCRNESAAIFHQLTFRFRRRNFSTCFLELHHQRSTPTPTLRTDGAEAWAEMRWVENSWVAQLKENVHRDVLRMRLSWRDMLGGRRLLVVIHQAFKLLLLLPLMESSKLCSVRFSREMQWREARFHGKIFCSRQLTFSIKNVDSTRE